MKIAPRKIVQELNLLELTVQGVKLKVLTVRTGYAAELAKVIKPEQSDAAQHDTHIHTHTHTHTYIYIC